MTREDIAWLRVFAALEQLYPEWKPAPGKKRPSEILREAGL